MSDPLLPIREARAAIPVRFKAGFGPREGRRFCWSPTYETMMREIVLGRFDTSSPEKFLLRSIMIEGPTRAREIDIVYDVSNVILNEKLSPGEEVTLTVESTSDTEEHFDAVLLVEAPGPYYACGPDLVRCKHCGEMT